MARKVTRVTISREGRDKGKVYVLTEMPASKAERWAARALLTLTNAGAELPDDILTAGMAGVVTMSIQALTRLPFDQIEPLMTEMFECVQICPDPRNSEVVRDLIEDDIEEVTTRLMLRRGILELHVGFSLPGVQSKSAPETPIEPEVSRITRTSPAPLAS